MSAVTYTRFELVRTFRNVRFFVFSLAFPVGMFFLIATPNRDVQIADGISFPEYYVAGMVAFGTMIAVLAAGGRISAERAVGWNRQLRITPLSTRAYMTAKVLTGYAMAALTIALLFLAGSVLGVRLPVTSWLTMIGLVIVALIPFAAGGILLGHLLTPDSLGPAMGGLTAVLAVLGGAWGPISSGFMLTLAQLLPSYWLVQAGSSAVTGQMWPAKAWIVIAVWTVVLGRLAATVYRRDTKRV